MSQHFANCLDDTHTYLCMQRNFMLTSGEPLYWFDVHIAWVSQDNVDAIRFYDYWWGATCLVLRVPPDCVSWKFPISNVANSDLLPARDVAYASK